MLALVIIVVCGSTMMVSAHMPSEHFQPIPVPTNIPRLDVGKGNPIHPTPGKYITKGGPVADKLNIHIVPHTHVGLLISAQSLSLPMHSQSDIF